MNSSSAALAVPSIRRAAIETLEQRCLLAFTGPNFDLPFVNDFSVQRNGIEDRDGQNTGFPIVQGNDAADEYQQDLIDLDLDAGLLFLTSRGDADNGGNFGDDNSLANGLQLPFDAASDTWTAHARISAANAPLTQFDTAFEQAGILYGPTQDNFIKLVFGHDGSNRVVQFVAETTVDGELSYPGGTDGFKSVVTGVQGVDLDDADYIDLWLSGDPSDGTISAQYRVEGGQTVRFEQTFDFDGALQERFFRADNARAGVMVQHKNDEGPITVAFDEFGVERDDLPSDRPAVENVIPGEGDTDVNRDAFVAVDLELPNAGIDEDTLTDTTVRLIRTSDGRQVPARLNTTGGGDAIILQPLRVLDAQTEYRFEITNQVRDLFDVTFAPYEQTFTTGFGLADAGTDEGVAAFDQIALSNTLGELWTSLNVGPDDRLYATTVDGRIVRFDIEGDGTLGDAQTITSIIDAEGENRVMTGLTFAPGASADDLVAYVTHTDFNDVTTDQPDELGQDFTGKVTRVSGDDLESVQDVVVGLPRSIRDHLTNQPSFGPDGRLYVPQGANTAMGEPDPAWGFREERLLTAAMLAIDVDAIGSGTVNVNTEDGDPYDPFAQGAPVTLYATGIRNAYDMLWHSNGRLYVPTNGSAAGGNTPESPQPGTSEFGDDRVDLDENGEFEGDFVPGLQNVSQTQNDYLFDVVQGGYYGHPNPTRDEWVLNGGNPTGGDDRAEVSAYPVGTRPDRNWRGFAYDFGEHISPNGVIEYQAGEDVFGGSLNGKMIVTRYSGGDDLVAIELDEDGNVLDVQEGIIGFGGFDDPLDLAQRDDGAIYVAEFGGAQITLLRPVEQGGRAQVAARRAFVSGEGDTQARFTIRNVGDAPLLLSSYTLTLTGEDREVFDVDDNPTEAVAVQPGATHTFNVNFTPPDDAQPGDIFNAAVSVRTNDPDAPEVTTRLVGLTTRNQFGVNEPSLQRILDLYDFGIDTGDDDPSDPAITPGGDLINASLFRQADPNQAVTIVPIASFGGQAEPAASVGLYPSSHPQDRFRLQEILGVQAVDPAFNGTVKFDPSAQTGSDTFGLFAQFPTFTDNGNARVVYSEAQLNTFEPAEAERQKVFTYPITLGDGTTLPDSYIVAFEEFPDATDANDVVLIVRNVEPLTADDGPSLQVTSPFLVPYTARLVMSTIDPAGREPGEKVRDSIPVTIRNIGTDAISLVGASASGLFSVGGFSAGTLTPGQSATFNVNFTADAGDLNDGELGRVFNGTLSVADDDSGQADLSIPLVGHNQRYTEDGIPVGITPGANAEPTFEELVSMFGFDIDVGTPEELNNRGIVEAVGDEVLSPFWRASGEDLPIEVYQLVAYHQVPTEDFFAWYNVQTPDTRNEVVRNEGLWSQSVLPAINGGTGPAVGSFEPGDATFGIRVSGEDSNSAENFNSQDDQGHHVRFFPVRDDEGNFVEDTWLMTMDFAAINFDFNDNLYLIRNMRPASNDAGEAAPPVGLSGFRRDGTLVLDWGADEGADGFAVFRSTGGPDNFQRLHEGAISADFFIDTDPPDGEVFYRVHSIADGGELAMFSEVRVV